MNENKIKGLVTELQCQTYLTSLGYNVFVPLGEDCRYDLIADFDGILTRIQIKSCTENETGISISVKSVRMNHTQGNVSHPYSKEEIDYFATFYKNKMYLIPVEQCGTGSKHLDFISRTDLIQKDRLSLDDCLAENQIKKLIDGNNTNDSSSEKIISQYDLKNNYIATYSSYQEAALALGKDKKCNGHISQAARGIRKTAYGYIWKLEER